MIYFFLFQNHLFQNQPTQPRRQEGNQGQDKGGPGEKDDGKNENKITTSQRYKSEDIVSNQPTQPRRQEGNQGQDEGVPRIKRRLQER